MPPAKSATAAAGKSDRPRGGNRRPPWLRGMSEADFKALIARRELHGLVLAMSTENYRAICTHDLWLRCIIVFFAGISALGAGLAWRNIAQTAELQIRLVRASELNSHLKEMNLAAAGLAHETRNPLNIIRGQAQMISRLPDAPPEVREKSQIIMDETDKVTAQLTEFINYSRPREVRRAKIALTAAANEIVRTLNYDIEEKKMRVEVSGDPLAIEADEQLLRQVLFNLLINAIQAVGEGGQIQIYVRRASATEANLEIRDDGPGVPPENRAEIFKPYFTTHQKGTGLGLAVVSANRPRARLGNPMPRQRTKRRLVPNHSLETGRLIRITWDCAARNRKLHSEMPRILIVDDDPGQRSLLDSFLRGQGFETVTADSGERALEILRAGKFAMMISDVRMPGLTGLETFRLRAPGTRHAARPARHRVHGHSRRRRGDARWRGQLSRQAD